MSDMPSYSREQVLLQRAPSSSELNARHADRQQSYRVSPRQHLAAETLQLVERTAPVMVYGTLVIFCSAGFVNLNSYLMQKGMFPFAVPLVMLQASFTTCMCAMLLIFRPKLFPSLTDPEHKVYLDSKFLLRRIAPVAVFFTAQLALSNVAYNYASVAFLQMIKESNLVTVYVMSVILGFEILKFRQVSLILTLVLATLATIKGELQFEVMGLGLQGACCLCECTKLVVQGLLLSGSGKKLDALSYVLQISPLCLFFLLVLVAVHVTFVPLPMVELPQWSDVMNCKYLIAINVMTAFVLNLAIAFFFKHSSAMAFLLVGVAKDALIVLACALIFEESIGSLQAVAFAMQLLLVFVWSVMKSFPEVFDLDFRIDDGPPAQDG